MDNTKYIYTTSALLSILEKNIIPLRHKA